MKSGGSVVWLATLGGATAKAAGQRPTAGPPSKQLRREEVCNPTSTRDQTLLPSPTRCQTTCMAEDDADELAEIARAAGLTEEQRRQVAAILSSGQVAFERGLGTVT